MEQTRFTTFDECLDYVSLSLGIYANDHDVIAIAREAFTFDEQKQSFVLVVSESEYWELVDKLDELKKRYDGHVEPHRYGTTSKRLSKATYIEVRSTKRVFAVV